MKLQILSDLHLESFDNDYMDFLDEIQTDADVLAIAGDLTTKSTLDSVLSELCGRYSHVVYVLGNHEFYGGYNYSDLDKVVCEVITYRNQINPNFHYLDYGHVIIDGHKFIGNTMWFPDSTLARTKKNYLNDFNKIRGFESWVYHQNRTDSRSLFGNTEHDDIVITHHLPSFKSVNDIYKDSPLNCYFVNDMERLIANKQPKLWVHGHTHESCDYMIGDTRVICNPFGYKDHAENSGFNYNLVIDI